MVKDSSNNEGVNYVLIPILLALTVVGYLGILRLTDEVAAKSEAIAKLEKEAQNSAWYLSQCQSEFRGYRDGRR